jgi:hypothetical protein
MYLIPFSGYSYVCETGNVKNKNLLLAAQSSCCVIVSLRLRVPNAAWKRVDVGESRIPEWSMYLQVVS